MKPVYEVAVCDRESWDWQASIIFNFDTIQKAIDFMILSLHQELLVQIKYNSDLDE